MPSRTLEELQDTVDASLAWRRIELSALQAEVERSSLRSPASPLARSLARSGVALLYAHWEGFVKDALRGYVEYVSRRRLKYAELNDGLLLSVFGSLHRRVDSGDGSAAQTLLDAVRSPESARAQIPRSAMVNTRSNLRYAVFSEILTSVGMDVTEYSTKEQLIDRLLCDARNEIAHGREQFPTADDYGELHLVVLGIMETLRDRVIEAVRTEAYKVSTS